MKKAALLLSLSIIGFFGNVSAQLTGTKNIPGDYATLALAITDLNAVGVGAGGVTLNLVAGNPQTAPAGGYSITTLTGTTANRIIIEGNGNTITASAVLTVGLINDAIFKIIGSDFVTIQNFVMQENPANTVNTPSGSNNMTEFGVALFYTSATDGAKNNTIKGNTISLNRTYLNTFGIYSNTRHTATNMTTAADITSAGGSNSNNQVYSNTISNVNMGITFIGSNNAGFQDQGNIIGTPSQGNTITNWGGAGSLSSYVSNSITSYGIFMNHQRGSVVRGNTLSTVSAMTNSTLRAIVQDYTTTAPAACTNVISRNLITVSSAQITGTFNVIAAQGGSNSESMFIDSNLIQGCAVTGAASAVGFRGIQVAGNLGGLTIRYNGFGNATSTQTTGTFTAINIVAAMGGNCDVNHNIIGATGNDAITFSAAMSANVNGISFTGTGGAGVGIGLNDNSFHGFVFNVTASSAVNMIQQTSAVGFTFLNNNIFDNLSFNTTGQIDLINNDMAGSATSNVSVSGNTIVGSCAKTASGGSALTLISGAGSSAAGATRVIQNNIFSGVSTVNSNINGISETGGVTTASITRTIINNTMSNWSSGGALNFGIIADYMGNGSTVSSNTISAITSVGNLWGIRISSNCGGTVTCFSNNVNNLNAAGVLTAIQVNGGASFTSLEIANSILSALAGTNTTFGTDGIEINGATGTMLLHDNFISGISASVPNAALTTGIYISSASGNCSVYSNKIYDIQNNNTAGGATGIHVANCGTLDVYNNYIGDLRGPTCDGITAATGINVAGGTTINLTYNTIRLSNAAGGTNSGASCIRVATGSTVSLANNLLVNLSTTTGSGVAAAYSRTTTALGTYANTSDHNNFYAGTPSASNLIFYDGTNSDQTLAQFQTRVGPTRDANSITENTTFASTVGSSPVFLHIPAATASLCESGGMVIAGITTDWDTDTRPGPVGSVNGGALAPDIGADEFDGILATCSGTPSGGTASAAIPTQCEGSTFDLSLTGASTGTAFTYQWQSSAVSGGPYTNVAGATTASYTTAALSSTTYFVCVVTCTVSGLSATSTEVACTVNPNPVITFSPTSPAVCAGGPAVNIVASGANSYSWSPATGLSSSTINNPDANPAATTTYTVTGTSVSGCTGTETITVTVNPLPTVGATSSPTAICAGSNATLTGTGATNYIWAPLFVSGTSISVNPSSTSSYTVTGTDGNGCTNTAIVTVTVNPVPTVNASADFDTVCAGSPVTLTGSGASTYVWDPGTISGSPIVVNPLTNTTYTVTGTDLNGCSDTATTSVVVNPLPSISASASATDICEGSFSMLSASGANTYVWMPGSLTGSSVIVSPASTTTYTVTGTDATGCSASTTITINVNPRPTVTITGASFYCQFGSTTLTSSAGATYQWYLNGAQIAGATSSTYNASAPGIYNVMVATPFGCADSAATGHTLIENPAPIVSFTASPSLTVCAGSSLTLSGTGTVSYVWSGGIIDGSPFAVAASSSYTVTGTDASGCTNTAVASVTVNPLPTVTAIATPASTVCSGQMVTLNGSGASSYTWTGGVSDGVPFSATTTTTYTVTGTDANGCTNTDGITINVNALPTVSIISSPGTSICDGSSVTLNGSGAMSYSWTGGVINGNPFTPVSTASYTVTGTDGNGCQNTASVTITINPVPTVSFSASPSTSVCTGSSVTLSGTGATSYSWTGGVSDGVPFTPASTASYTVTGTDGNGCTNTASVTVTVNPLPTVGATAAPGTSVCSGSPVTLNGTGAASYTWSGGVTDGISFVPPSTNTYTVTGTSGAGCTGTATITVTVNPLPTIGATASPSTSICSGSSVTLNGTGGTSYVWSGGVVDGVAFAPPSTASYVVTGTDAMGCTNSSTITITVNPLPTVSSSVSPSSTVCAGTMVTLTGNGASSYAWTGGVTDGVPFAATSTATYTVTGTDVNGCTGTATRTITVNPAPTVSAAASPSASVCQGSSVTLSGSGATVYTWTGGVTDGVAFTPPSTQTYTVTGTDAIGCSNTATITVTVNPLPTVGSTASPGTTVCSGTMVTLNGTGATSYSWSGGISNGVPFSATTTTNYTVTGTSAAGCTNTATTTITVNPAPAISAAASPGTTVCQGTMVTLNGFGGSGYAWTGGVSDGVPFSASSTNTYTVTGTDGNGCTGTSSITITVNPAPNVNAVQSPAGPVCSGSSVTLNGTGALSYAWSSGVTNGVAFVPASTATYTVTGTGFGGCTGTATITVVVNPLPAVSSTASPGTTVCSGTPVTLNGTGATSYTWTGGVSNGVPFTAVATNTYTVTGTAANGCTNTATTTITVNPSPTVASTATPTTTVCAGTSVTLNGSGANTYSWSGGVSNGVPFTPPSTATYTVTGTALNGCTGTATTTITVNPLPTVGTAVTPSPLVCSGTMVTLNGTGAVTYSWSGGVTDNVPFSATASNNYTVTGTDGNGCVGTATTSITVMPNPTVSFVASPGTSICTGTQLTLDGTGATTYAWSDTTVIDGNPFIPMASDTFIVTGTDGNGCSDTAIAIITVNTPPTVTASVSPSATVCENTMITLSGSGATTYAWSHGVTNNVAFAAGTTTTYTVVGTDGNGCSDTTTQTVNVIAAPNVNITGNSTFCTGGNTVLSTSGGTTYQWYMNGAPIASAASSSYTANAAGVYNVWVTNASGCGDSASVGVNVTINTPPTVIANATATAICRGSSVTLFGSGAVSYAWSAGVNNNVPFTPLNTLTYTVVGTASNGCTDMDTITVVVHALPVVSSTASPAYTVCAGTAVTLSGTGAQTYSWTGGVIDATPFTPVSTSTYTVTGSDVFGCTGTAAVTVTVNPLPVVALGPDVTQCGGSVSLDAANPGSTYAWSNSATSQLISVTASGTYSVAVTNSFGCSASDAINVTINAQPMVDLGVDDTLCTASVTLDAMNPGASYLWNDLSTAQTLNVSASGIYYVTATMPGGCTSTDTVMLVLHTPPSVTLSLVLDTVCLNGGSVALAGETPSGGMWSGTGVSGASFDPMVSGTGTFGITYMFTDTNGCSDNAVDSIFVDPCLGTPDVIAVADFNMYPNPNNGDFNIEISGTSSADVMIYNAAGQLVQQQRVNGGEVVPVSLDASGMYMVTIVTDEGQHVTKRVVVNR